MIRACTDSFVSFGEAANGAWRVVFPVSTRNHHQGGMPACSGASTEQSNVSPSFTNWNSFVTLPLERMIQSSGLPLAVLFNAFRVVFTEQGSPAAAPMTTQALPMRNFFATLFEGLPLLPAIRPATTE